MHALIQNGSISQVGPLPRLWHDGTRWWDFRDDAIDPAEVGWHEVTRTPQPGDTDTHTHDLTYEVVDGQPTQVWTARGWTADELAAREQAAEQEARRQTHEGILDATAALMNDAHADGATWVQPTGAHDAYPLGRTVTHGGKTWVNITPANVWEPGVSGWREVVAEGYPAWVQPTGGHDAYNTGDRVTFEGQDWESTIDGNVWSPTAHPAGWKLIP